MAPDEKSLHFGNTLDLPLHLMQKANAQKSQYLASDIRLYFTSQQLHSPFYLF